jgi:hypothetical protein
MGSGERFQELGEMKWVLKAIKILRHAQESWDQ